PYTRSQVFPALLPNRPILALFHEASSVVSILRTTGSEPSVRVVTYGDGGPSGADVETVARHLQALALHPRYDPAGVSLARAMDVSARSLARQLAAVFDRVAA